MPDCICQNNKHFIFVIICLLFYPRGETASIWKAMILKLLYFNLIMDKVRLEFNSNNRTLDVTSLIEAPCNSEFSKTLRKDAIKTAILSNWEITLIWSSRGCLCTSKHFDESQTFLFPYILHFQASSRTIKWFWHLTARITWGQFISIYPFKTFRTFL